MTIDTRHFRMCGLEVGDGLRLHRRVACVAAERNRVGCFVAPEACIGDNGHERDAQTQEQPEAPSELRVGRLDSKIEPDVLPSCPGVADLHSDTDEEDDESDRHESGSSDERDERSIRVLGFGGDVECSKHHEREGAGENERTAEDDPAVDGFGEEHHAQKNGPDQLRPGPSRRPCARTAGCSCVRTR